MRKLDFLFFHFFVIGEEKINWDSMRDRGTADGASPAAGQSMKFARDFSCIHNWRHPGLLPKLYVAFCVLVRSFKHIT